MANRFRASACLILIATLAAADPLVVTTPRLRATFDRGLLTSLADAAGHAFVASGREQGLGILCVKDTHWAQEANGATSLRDKGEAARTYVRFTDLDGATASGTVAIDEPSGELVVTQRCTSPTKGVWGVQWSVAHIPLTMNIIVAGRSGLRLTRHTPGATHSFSYPIGWEAQLVIVEGEGRGFYVWADDAKGRFKRLVVRRSPDGWRLELATANPAPFAPHTACESVRWRLGVYTGDWRVPARRYRDWAVAHLHPTPIAQQRPAWVRDIRCCVIMGMDIPLIEALAKRLDPAQTLLYVPSWRKAGYDRDYPTYDEPFEKLAPFIARAHQLGYRVMLHVNYFGCDPLHPLYKRFEPFQVRSPWHDHARRWWLWTRADPVIKFAYINPAHKPWRDLFVARMKTLCTTMAVDALHLDQTLCIYNDHNGLIDGQSMVHGNIALHAELRAALPDVAISGEGLNEVTYRHEAFAQRHVWGIRHSEGTWHRPQLDAAHPICSYLFRPYTIIYGYLGCARPSSAQLYAAWQEAYRRWGVIPTLKPSLAQLRKPSGFARQFFDEATLWQQQRLEPDVDGPWPPDVAFPLRTRKGERVAYTADHRLVWGSREVYRTLTGAGEYRLPGTIPGWHAYDRDRLFGLRPEAWYPYVAEPRDPNAFHLEAMPPGYTPTSVAECPTLAIVRLEPTQRGFAQLTARLDEALCGSAPFGGKPVEMRGPLTSSDGAHIKCHGTTLFAHPPWKADRKNPDTGVLEAHGTGIAYARFDISLPKEGALRFVSGVAVDAKAEGKTDGVTFAVRCGQARAEIHNALAEPKELALDLSPFAGQQVTIELSVHPGPKRAATYDWARWLDPRIERDQTTDADLVLVSQRKWALGLSGTTHTVLEPQGSRYRVRAHLPGAVFLLAQPPRTVALPLDLAAQPFETTLLSSTGTQLATAPHARAIRGTNSVGGEARAGLFTHPPNHGLTVADFALTLPAAPAELHTFVGLRDRSKSEGVVFRIEANGMGLARVPMKPGGWRAVTCDLSAWAGKPVVLSLITDSDGPFSYDWAAWGEPTLRKKAQ